MRTSVVLFDLDDTLFAHREAVDAGVLATLAAMEGPAAAPAESAEQARWRELEELHYPRRTAATPHEAARRNRLPGPKRYLTGELDYQGQRRARVRDFLAPYGAELDDAAAEAWFEDYSRRYRAAYRLHADALPCLDDLERHGIRFGIITNGDLAFQTAKLHALGITGRFEHVITSGELGVAKPDRRIFEVAARRFGVRTAACAYVGDRLWTDALGATRAGMLGIWLDRGTGVAAPSDLEEARRLGVPVLTGLDGLPAVLTRTEAA